MEESSVESSSGYRRSFGVFLRLLAIVGIANSASAQATLDATLVYEPADIARSAFDVGGAWDGTNEVTLSQGDSLRYTIANSSATESATDLAITIDLPAEFLYVATSATGDLSGGGSVAGIDGTQAGSTLTITSSGDIDLAPGESLDLVFGLTTTNAAVAGTYSVSGSIDFGTDDGPATESDGPTAVLVSVLEGDTVVEVDPATQTVGTGGTATFTITLTNSGLGGLFDVAIDESALIPTNAAGSLTFVSATQTPANSPRAIPGGGILTAASPGSGALVLPYLGSDESFTVVVEATVDGCLDIENEVATRDRTGNSDQTTLAAVTLDLDQPLIDYLPPTVTVPYSGAVAVSFDVNSLGLGDAMDVRLATNYPARGLTVTPSDPATWSYNAGAGEFTLLASSGTISSASSIALEYTVSASDVCLAPPSGFVAWNTSYTNVCDDEYSAPSPLQSITDADDVPELVLAKTIDEAFVQVGGSGQYTIDLSATNASNMSSDPVVITDELPAIWTIDAVTPAAGVSCPGGTCEGGEILTWTVPAANLAAGDSLVIDFSAPTDTCTAGTEVDNVAEAAGTTAASCDLDAESTVGAFIVSGVDATVDAQFDIGPGSTFETGRPDGGDGVRQTASGEGEFIPITASYVFSAGYSGVWEDTVYTDDFAGLAGQTLVPNTAQYTFTPSGGGAVSGAVPAASITSSTGSLVIELDFVEFLAGSDADLDGDEITLVYQTTASDADIPVPAATRSLTQRSTLDINGAGTSGSCTVGGNTLTQGDFYSIARAQGNIFLSMPPAIDLCSDFPVTLSVEDRGPGDPSNILATLVTGSDYEVELGQTPTPASGTFFDTEPTTYSENAGTSPFFTVNDPNAELSGLTSFALTARRRASSGTTPTSLGARLDYDDNESLFTSGTRDFFDVAGTSPALIRQGELSLFVSPQAVSVVGDQVSWLIYVTNLGDGLVTDADIIDTLPPGLVPDAAAEAATNAANSPNGIPNVVITGQEMRWSVGDLTPGESVVIELIASVEGNVCTIPDGTNTAAAEWGCGGVVQQLTSQADPDFVFPVGDLQVFHDSRETICRLCDGGEDLIVVRNTGATQIFDVVITEVTNPSTTGISVDTASAEYSLDGGAFQPVAMAPTGTGESGDPYTFGADQIPELAELRATTESVGTNEVQIRFDLINTELTNAASPVLIAQGTGEIACGNSVTSPADLFPVTVNRPDFTVAKRGRNITADPAASFAETVYAALGDTVEWEVVLTNGGEGEALNVRLADLFPRPGSSGTIISGPAGFATPTAIANDTAIDIPDIAAGSSATFVIEETLSVSCVDANNTADVSWGCVANGAGARSNLTTPTDSDDTSALVMLPNFASSGLVQTLNALPGGRFEIEIDLENLGGRGESFVLTDRLPTGFEFDSSFTPILTSTQLTLGVVDPSDPTEPIFNLTGTLRRNDTAELRFRVVPIARVDVLSDPFVNPEVAPGTDPAATGPVSNEVQLDWESSCGVADTRTNSTILTPLEPDLDVSVTPDQRLVADGDVIDFAFSIVNNGPAGSTADRIRFDGEMGLGWTSITANAVTGGGATNACTVTCAALCDIVCDEADTGSLTTDTLTINVQATANDNGASLGFTADVEGSLSDDAGTDTTRNYSFDEITPRILGFDFDKTFNAGSSSQAATTDPNLLIGEEATWRVSARWFGGTPVSNLIIRDTLPAGLGYVSDTQVTGAADDVTISATSAPTPTESGIVEWTVADLAGGAGTFEADLRARALNIEASVDEGTLTNNVGASFDGFDSTFASDSDVDGFGGSLSSAHAEQVSTLQIPVLRFDKQVSNLTTGTGPADSAAGDAGDEFEYVIEIENEGTGPAFDLAVNDLLDAKLEAISLATDTVDNDGDGTSDGADANEGTLVSGVQDALSFDDANTALAAGSPETTFAQLDPGQTLTLRYRATAASNVAPSEVLDNDADLFATTLPGVEGAQTDTGDEDGERILTANDTATVNADSATFGKSVITTAQGNDASLNVVIGEQIRFQLAVELPEGAVDDFEIDDQLPEGLRLVQTPAVSFGSAFADTTQPTITPGSLPASGSPLAVNWDFGSRTVGAGNSSARSITVLYVAQVENLAALGEGDSLVNDASYSFNGAPTNMTDVTLTVREPLVAVEKTILSGAGPYASGDLITFQVEITNTGNAAAYDLQIQDTFPTGLTYEADSTTLDAGTGPLLEPDVSGQVITWGRAQSVPQNIDLASGTYRFTYQGRVNGDAIPGQALQNDVDVDWTSLDGSPGADLGVAVGTAGGVNGERDGSTTGTVPYSASSAAITAVLAVYDLTKNVRNDEPDAFADGFRIGDLVTFEIIVDMAEVTTPSSVIEDILPAGLEFASLVSVSPASGVDGFTYTLPAGVNLPSAGDAGTLSFTFGQIVNAVDGDVDNDQITLVYRARVTDDLAFPPATTSFSLDEDATFRYEDAASVPQATDSDGAPFTVLQPALDLAKDLQSGQATTVGAGDTVGYRLEVDNTGLAPSYNIELRDVIPAGQRVATPAVTATTLDGVSISLGVPSYSSATGILSFGLSDTQTLLPGDRLVIEYETTVDDGVGGGVTMTNSARVDDFYSRRSADSTERRSYGAGAADSESVSTPSPSDLTKAVDLANANIGDTVVHTLTIPGTAVSVPLYDVRVLDSVSTALRLESVTDNAGALGTTVSSATIGNAVDRTVEVIPAGEQWVVTLTSTVLNVAATQSATPIDNEASFTWAMNDGGSASQPIESNTVQTVVTEPVLDVRKMIVDPVPATDVGGGDRITFQIELVNTGDGPAYDIVIEDYADEAFQNPIIGAGGPTGITEGSTTSGTTIWAFDSLPGPIAGGATFSFEVSFEIANSVSPFQNLSNGAVAEWTSTSGPNPDERIGSGTPPLNDYMDSASTTRVTIGPAGLMKTVLMPTGGTVSIGEEITYALTLDTPTGQLNGLSLVDRLPSGLVFVSASLTSAADLEQGGGGSVAVLTGPSAGDTGTLTFDFGDLASTGSDPALVLELVARVQDIPANSVGTDFDNDADAIFENPDDPGNNVTVSSGSVMLDVVVPDLYVALDGPTNLEAGVAADFTLRAVNIGGGEAYQPVFEIELPEGLRSEDPGDGTITLSIGGTPLTPADYVLDWNPATGLLELSLTTSAGVIPAGAELVFGFQATPVDVADGDSLSATATATEYSSQDIVGGVGPDVRQTTSVLGSGTSGTANGGVPDDDTDDHSAAVNAPTLSATKAVSDDGTPAPGEMLSYLVTLSNSGAVDAADTVFVDELDAAFEAGTLTNVVVTPALAIEAPGALTVDASGGSNGTGRIEASGLRIAAGSSVTLSFDVQLDTPLPNGTVIRNQGGLTLNGFSDPILTDSTNPADDDGVESGNADDDPNDDDPTQTVIGSMPILEVTKIVADDNGAPLLVGEVLTYTIVVTNSGDETAVAATLQDGVPGGTTYVADSTMLNGVAVADVSDVTALATGMLIASPGAPDGELRVDEPATIVFQVTVDADVQDGALVSNQANLVAEGEGSGPLPPDVGTESSDDPNTPEDDDPTVIVVGDAPRAELAKSVLDENGGSLDPGDFLTWTLTLRNLGGGPLVAARIEDVMPANVSYVADSIQVDPDGSGPMGPMSVSDAADGDAGDFGWTVVDGLVYAVGDVPAGEEVQLIFRTQVDGGVAEGTVLSNQAEVSATGVSPELSDDDGDDENGDQPTQIVVGSAPALRLSKDVFDLNGGMVLPGDLLEYRLTLENIGSDTATNVRVLEPSASFPPTGTTYEDGTTTLDGGARPDSGAPAMSELTSAGGVSLGSVAAGDARIIRVRVRIDSGASDGTVLENQASYSGDAGLSGPSDSSLDDGVENGNDPGDPNDDDPTRLSIGGSASLASVEGFVWLDEDHDRNFGAGEVGQPGWTVEILRAGVVVGTTQSDVTGSYSFSGLPPGGGYEIRFRHPDTGVLWGQPVSGGDAADTSGGTLADLYLPPGVTILDQSLPIDPSGVVYDSLLRTLVPGATVSISGPPGFDPATQLLAGQQGQTTSTDGYYRFDLLPNAPPGNYTLSVTPPAGYIPPASVLIPPQSTLDLPPGTPDPFEVLPFPGAPQTGDPTTYHLSFVIEAGDPNVVNNHIPLDPVLEGAIAITKTTPRLTVSRSEIVPYTIRATNTLSVDLPNVAIQDLIPPGFVYVEGSGRVDGVQVEPVAVNRLLTWGGLTMPAQGSIQVQLLLIVGAAATEGDYVNRTWALNELIGERMSNEGQATVRIVPDPTFDCSDILGRVFDDRNGNGYHDKGELGVPKVRFFTARGLMIESDDRGRFHVTCPMVPREDRGSNFILKLDERTLPTGFQMTTENPRVIRLTRGKFAEIAFGVSRLQEVRLDLESSAWFQGRLELTMAAQNALGRVTELMKERPSLLRIIYHGSDPGESDRLREARVKGVEKEVRKALTSFWKHRTFEIETEIRDGRASAGKEVADE